MDTQDSKIKLELNQNKRYEISARATLKVYRFYLESAKVNEKIKMNDILWLIGFDNACYQSQCEEISKGLKFDDGCIPIYKILIEELNRFKKDAEPSIRERVQEGEDSFWGFLKIKERYKEYQRFDDFRDERINFPFVCTLQQLLINNSEKIVGTSSVSELFDDLNINSFSKDFSETES